MEFAGQVVLITGAGAGIGKGLACAIANKGAQIVAVDRDGPALDELIAEITTSGGHAEAHVIDVTDEVAITRVIEDTASRHGRLDYVFNNAGIAIGGDARDLAPEHWSKVLAVNWNGVLYGTLAAYRIMTRQGFGHIVNTASGTGLVPQPGNAPYCASKHAVVGLSLSLRYEGADLGVKVSAICPGHVATDIYRAMTVVNIPREKVIAGLPAKPMSVSEAVEIVLRGIRANQALIVFPANMRLAWRLNRLFPRLMEKAWLARIRKLRLLREAPHASDRT
jgi:NAD(P)-dependent dehydrogenase (short-subunit alcohol dehydrogenase family)